MKIAQISPLAESVPPQLYGGTERVVSYLTEELVQRGHDVTLYASGDSITSADLVPIVPKALRLDAAVKMQLPYSLLQLERVLHDAHKFDILHFHNDIIHLPYVRTIKAKALTTLHGRMDLPDLFPLYEVFNDIPLVTISDSQRKPMPPVNWMGSVLHGLPIGLYKPQLQGGPYLAFLGRISPEKGPDSAIAIAERVQMPLKIAAKVDAVDQEYFDQHIRRLLNSPLIDFIGEINDREKESFLGNAAALLFPIDWEEPFGLTMIEAMAVGTPVIAFNRGSVPEIIDNGVSGFIVQNIEEAANAIHHLGNLDRGRVRRCFEERFTARRMADNYVRIYDRLLATAQARRGAWKSLPAMNQKIQR